MIYQILELLSSGFSLTTFDRDGSSQYIYAMKKLLCFLFVLVSFNVFGQEAPQDLQTILRANILSPGVECELPVSDRTTLTANTGVGVSGSYLNLSYTNSGITYFVAPFLDLSYKLFYNRDSRLTKGKNVAFNSGNYWSLRLLTNFKEIASHNIIRKDNIDFAFGPTWGLQRSYGKFHLLFDVGPFTILIQKETMVFFQSLCS